MAARTPAFGIALPQSSAGSASLPADSVKFAQAAEDAGLHSLWVQEQVLGRDPSLEPVVHLAHVAAVTKRVRLGTAAVIAPVRNAVVLAKQLASLDCLSGGRLTVGVALGDMEALYRASGVRRASRAARLERFLEIARQVWATGTVNYDDGEVQLSNAPMTPQPVQRPYPPIWFGGRSQAALDRTLRIGNGWIGAGGGSTRDFAAAARYLRAQPRGAADAFTLAKKLYIAVDRDPSRAWDQLLGWFVEHWGGPSARQLGQRVGVAGTAADCARAIAQVAAAGADLVILNPVRDEHRQLDLLVEQVIPQVRTLIGELP